MEIKSHTQVKIGKVSPIEQTTHYPTRMGKDEGVDLLRMLEGMRLCQAW